MRALILVVAAALIIACDPSQRVQIQNATGQRIVLLEDARNPQVIQQLEPGEQIRLNWMIEPLAADTERLREVRATSLDGQLLFCRKVTYGDMRTSGWALTVRLNQIECGN